jgi:hypothetical protein
MTIKHEHDADKGLASYRNVHGSVDNQASAATAPLVRTSALDDCVRVHLLKLLEAR